jgi:hypothetical protein
MDVSYPIYYEEAAHITHVLHNNGMPLNARCSIHTQLAVAAITLRLLADGHRHARSHADAGAWLVGIFGADQLDEARRRRLNAIAGTLVGNFLLTCPQARTTHK